MPREGIRIAIDGRPALWPRTGIGTIARNVLTRIQQLDEANQYFAYFDRNPETIDRSWHSTQSRWGGSLQKLIWANTWLPRQLKRDQIDVFVTFLDKEVPLVPTCARIVSMVHDLIPMKFPRTVFRNPAHRVYYNALIRASVRRSDKILTNSEFSKREIVAELGPAEDKICKITLGVDVQPVVDQDRVHDVLRRRGIRKPYVIALGSTEPRKNNRRVIEAMRRLQSSHPDLQLAIAGSIWRGLSFEPGLLYDRARLLGHVSDEDLPVLMQSAEMLVFPSLHEGFGLPVIEAMALGVPVVTSNAGALPEVAADAALFADPTNTDDIAAQIRRVLEDPVLAENLRAKGRERARMFRWETTCAEIASVCRGLMEKREWQRQPVTP